MAPHRSGFAVNLWIKDTTSAHLTLVPRILRFRFEKMAVSFRRKIGSWLARYLNQQIKDYRPYSPSEISAVADILEPGDVLLVEGDTRVSTAVKYLTQSTWSHAAFYVGDIGKQNENGEACVLIEAELGEGVVASPLSRYDNFNVRVCRAIGLTQADRQSMVDRMVNSLGRQYDLKHIIDLARYLFPTPPVPIKFRRRLIAFGSGDPSRAICSSLVAETFQSIRYPILPRIEKQTTPSEHHYSVEEIYHIRHHSLFTPRDFDVSPFFEIIKPAVKQEFDYKTLKWDN